MKIAAVPILLSLVLSCQGGIAAELPVGMPGKPAPDYQASMMVEDIYGNPRLTGVSVLHHGGLSKVDRRSGGDVTTTYGNADVLLRVYGPSDARPEGMTIDRTDASSNYYYRVRGVLPTDDSAVQAGEKCRFYRILRQPDGTSDGPGYRSCLTTDGIEIGERVLFDDGRPMSIMSLAKLVRRPVDPRDVLPQAEWFQSRYWLEPMSEPDASDEAQHPDFVMTLQGDRGELMLWRRHYPWNYQEIRKLNGSRVVKVWNEIEFRGLYFVASKGGAFQSLHVERPSKPVRTSGYFGEGLTPKQLNRTESLLGEECTWFDMTPGMMDASNHQCMTQDKIALEVSHGSGWGPGSDFTAVSLMRRPVTKEELLPEKAILQPRSWGLEAVGG